MRLNHALGSLFTMRLVDFPNIIFLKGVAPESGISPPSASESVGIRHLAGSNQWFVPVLAKEVQATVS